MPAEEGLGLDVDQSVLPCEEPREQNHGQASGVRSPSRFDLALQIESQLFPKENILRFESSGRTRPQKQEPQNVLGQIKKNGNQPRQGMTASHGIEACHAGVAESNSHILGTSAVMNSRCTDLLRAQPEPYSETGTCGAKVASALTAESGLPQHLTLPQFLAPLTPLRRPLLGSNPLGWKTRISWKWRSLFDHVFNNVPEALKE